MKAFVPFVKSTIAKENTFFRAILQLTFIVWAQMGPTRTAKDLKEGVIWQFVKKELKWSFHV
jgi:hypothetical protein